MHNPRANADFCVLSGQSLRDAPGSRLHINLSAAAVRANGSNVPESSSHKRSPRKLTRETANHATANLPIAGKTP